MPVVCDEIHIGDIGTVFRFTFKDQDDVIVNINTATTQEVRFKKPDATINDETTTFVTDGTDGLTKFITTVVGDLDQEGFWEVQGHVILTSGEWRSNTIQFRVHPNL